MRLMKAVAPVMKALGRGRIVNIASVARVRPLLTQVWGKSC
jgi:NAD(P)-dependent dehydrogenase (short-subunit alcohol dehydrogenase family)